MHARDQNPNPDKPLENTEEMPVGQAPLSSPGQSPSLEGTVLQDDPSQHLAKVKSKSWKTIPVAAGYTILRKLGEGTYGEVYLAEEQNDTRYRVAIKFLTHGISQQWQMLQDEVRQLALLHDDPGIVQIQDANLDAHPPYYVMRYAEGGSLAERIKQGAVPVAEALPIFRRLAESLAYVHAKGIRHCDMKPGNVLLDALGRPLVADFGQAHLANDASPALGTFFYMAPEQADLNHQIPDTRWDVYGLGAVLFAMLTGKPPREDATLEAQLGGTLELSHRLALYRQLISQARKPQQHRRLPGMDKAMSTILERCLEIDPAKRFRSAGSLLEALDRRDRRRRQRPMMLFAVLAPLVLLFLMAGVAFWMLRDAIAQAKRTLSSQINKSSEFTAQLVANAVGEKLLDRMEFLEKDAQDNRLRKALGQGSVPDISKRLAELHEGHTHLAFEYYSVVNAEGEILMVHPGVLHPRQIKHYRWRDWFNGEGDKPESEWDKTLKPVDSTYISQPFNSKAQDVEKGKELGLGVNVSTPIRDTDGKILGLLVGTIALEDFNQWLTETKIKNGGNDPAGGATNASVVLLNARGYCLLHSDKRFMPAPGQQPTSWLDQVSDKQQRLFQNHRLDSAILDDPYEKKPFLASYAPLDINEIKKTNPLKGNPIWHVLVQQDEKAALEPIDKLYSNMLYFGLIKILVLALLIPVLWERLLWMMRLRERKAHA